ncbi:DUF1854 domain-containing protein [Herbaspirillum lusitanum]|uniref:DUF1854 domain-containing protein n=1 Tax=Herbaspirillum lusitanum TaxID=213312 RepID=A0ABW9AAU5_9BURK
MSLANTNTSFNSVQAATGLAFELRRNAFGRLVFIDLEGHEYEGAIPVRSFPVSAPDQGISVVSSDGSELAWIDKLSDLAPHLQAMIEEELASREFMPEILRIVGVSTYATPSEWQVETNRGVSTFTLKGEEDIRRLAQSALLIADTHGIQFLIRDSKALDKPSRKILDRFL